MLQTLPPIQLGVYRPELNSQTLPMTLVTNPRAVQKRSTSVPYFKGRQTTMWNSDIGLQEMAPSKEVMKQFKTETSQGPILNF